MAKIKVTVLMGGPSAEHEVSLSSGRQVVKYLDKQKYQIIPFVIPKRGTTWLAKLIKLLQSHDKQVVFIALHGPFGEDGAIQGLLDLIGVPYTGAGVLASALGMDKILFKKLMRQEKIPIGPYRVLKSGQTPKLKMPLVVKPSNQGSSIGVSLVKKKNQLPKALQLAFKYSEKIVVEKYLAGTEVSCGVLGNEKPKALPVVEIKPKNEFFDYEAKYQSGRCEEIVPARTSSSMTKKIQQLAIKVYQAIDCRGFGRVDMIIAHGQPYVLEINTIPGLTPNSLLPKEAAAAGITYSQLLDCLIQLALEK